MKWSLNGRGTNLLPLAGLIALGLLTLPASAGGQKPAAPAADAYLRELIPPAPAVHQVLRGDERLLKPVTVAMGDVPMADLLAELTKASNIALSASTDVADEMVVAGFKNRPLGSVMTFLSTHFGFTWRKKAQGYELWQDLASKNREQALRNARTVRLVTHAVSLGKLAEQPLGVLRDRRQKVVEAHRDPNLTPQARAQLGAELQALSAVSNSNVNFALRLLARAPTARLEQLAATGELEFSTERGEITPAEVRRWQSEREDEASLRGRSGQAPRDQTVEAVQTEYKLSGRDGTSGGASGLQLSVRHRMKGGSGSSGSGISGPPEERMVLPAAEDERLRVAVPPIARSFRYAGEFRSGPHLAAWRDHLSAWPDARPSRADILLALHAATGLDVLSDSFRPWRAPFAYSTVRPESNFEMLLKQVWSRSSIASAVDGDVLRLRQRDYFNLRLGSPPLRQVRAAIATVKPDVGSYLDAISVVAASLNEGQRNALVRDWGYLWANDRLLLPGPRRHQSEDMELPALLGSISAKLRAQLRGGETVPLRSIARADLALLEQALARSMRGGSRFGSRISAPRTAAAAPVAVRLLQEDQLQEVYATYDEQGRTRSQSFRTVRPGQPAQPPPNFGNGETPTMVGTVFPQTSYRLDLLGESGLPVRTLASLTLQSPAPFQFQRPREQAGGQSPR